MTNDSFKYSFKVTGLERKVVASIIAAAQFDGSTCTYAGAPSFCYQAAGWVIDREGKVTSPETPIDQKDSIRTVLDALKTAGASVEENGTVTFSLQGHNGDTLRNTVNLIWTKQGLLKKALDRQTDIVPASLVEAINAVSIDTLDDFAKVVNEGIEAGTIAGESDLGFDLADQTITFRFSNASLEADEVVAFISLCWQISEQAKQQKFSSTKQKDAENERYALRCYLLKLGFIGEEFKQSRKILLSKLSGSSAFRTIEAQQAAEAKRKASVLTERSENQ